MLSHDSVVELVKPRIGRRSQVQTLAEVIFFAISYSQIFKVLLAFQYLTHDQKLICDFINSV